MKGRMPIIKALGALGDTIYEHEIWKKLVYRAV
jgi:hypothetical protein